MRTSKLLLGIAITALSAWPSHATELFVSPSGDDANPGTEARPFRTLDRARDAARAATQAGERGMTVFIRGGVYQLDHPFTLSAQDSGSAGAPVVYQAYRGEHPVISGGVRLSGWTRAGSNLWKAKAVVADFRQLYVNGRRAVRARGAAPAGTRMEGPSAIFVPDARLAKWGHAEQLEAVFDIQWERSILKVVKITPAANGTLLSMLEPYFTLARMKEGKQIQAPSYFENALELLDEPGEWYLDRAAGEVYYMARDGERLESAEVIAPALERLIEVQGTLDRPVHDLRFEGLTFAYGSWLQPSRTGLVDVQANFTMPQTNLLMRPQPGLRAYGPGLALLSPVMAECVRSPANVVIDAAKAITFERCVFTHLGAAGLDILHGAQDNAVLGSRFEDIAGTAIQIGDVAGHHPKDAREVVRNNQVRNCYIRDVANQYIAGVGIFAGYTEGTVLSHNEITGLPYTGISVGWGWGETDAGGGGYYEPFVFQTPTVSRNNRIEYNHIHHVMQQLWDGAGIYTLGNMPGSLIRGNHVHDNPGVPGGIYLDEGSGFIEVTGNLVYNVKPWGKNREARPMNFNNRRQNRIETCKVHDNYFFVSRPPAPSFPQVVADQAGLETSYRDIR